MTDFTFDASYVSVLPARCKDEVSVEVSGADEDEIMNQIDIGNAINHYGESDILGKMGASTVVSESDIGDLLSEMETGDILDYVGISEIEEWLRNKGLLI